MCLAQDLKHIHVLLPISFGHDLFVNSINGHVIEVIPCVLPRELILEAQVSLQLLSPLRLKRSISSTFLKTQVSLNGAHSWEVMIRVQILAPLVSSYNLVSSMNFTCKVEIVILPPRICRTQWEVDYQVPACCLQQLQQDSFPSFSCLPQCQRYREG